MEKWQEDFTAKFYRTAGSSFQMHSQYPICIFTLWQDIFHWISITRIWYTIVTIWLPILWVVKNLNNATTNLHFKKKRMETRIIKNISNKNDKICRDVKTQKVCEQGWDG